MTPDVNVLVAAYRADHPHHTIAHRWLSAARRSCAHGTDTLRLLPLVISSFLRIVTSPRVFEQPDSAAEAVAFVDVLLQSPGVELATSGAEWALLRSKLLDGDLRGNLVTDAWIAASVELLSERLATFDRDFRKLLSSRSVTLLGSK